ncbi:ABC transporter permease [Campylobacter corcagiensis]|uniref:ABC transporter permease n=1 Tax=Campylobacter corcagiensis TaxID=1448857 RepID=A0A7M1LHM7_9BACT|nr:ABC transporter permease [Campylobacter corcagiensis]QKF65326.1 ABC transporter, permease protein, FtsX/LolC family [Campylobacter corcagiensis]QOQ88092.1 ABC transporter permease [Campylobacter corcagiensis]
MSFFKLFLADFRKDFGLISVMILLISATLSLSLLSILSERSLRLGSAAAADKFDLVVGAKGSEVQLVLSSVFLKPASLDLIDSKILDELKADDRVKWASPVGFGDFYQNFPVIGISKEMIEGEISEGENLKEMFDAVAGVDTGLKIGDTFSPMHGQFVEAGAHTHDDITYKVVGIKKRDNSAWDNSILVGIEAVWHVHSDHDHAHYHDNHAEHSHSHSHDKAHADRDDHDENLHDNSQDHSHEHSHNKHSENHNENNLDTHVINSTNKTNKHSGEETHQNHDDSELTHANKLGVPAIVVKPVSFAAAYQLRQDYKDSDDTIAVFPGEILAWLYALLGDAKSWLLSISIALQILAFGLVFGLSFLFIHQKRHQITELRVFGANVFKIMAYVWTELVSIILSGMIIGVILGFVLAKFISFKLGDKLGFSLITRFESGDFIFLGLVFLVSAVLCFIPVIRIYQISVAKSLKDN